MNKPKREVYKIIWEAGEPITYKEAVELYLRRNMIYFSKDREMEFVVNQRIKNR